MKKIILSLALSVAMVLGVNAQSSCCKAEAGDWYIGTGDIANNAWTDWSIAPTIGYGVTDKLMVGLNVSQADSAADLAFDLHARYFIKGYFVYVETSGLDTENLNYGFGKMFTFHRGVYVDPKIVFNGAYKTTNFMLGVGLKF